MFHSGREDYCSVKQLTSFDFIDSDGGSKRLGSITRAEIIKAAETEGYNRVRFLMEGDVYTQEKALGRLNVMISPVNRTITKIWEG